MSEQMKPSGIDYIGIIPCSWSIKRFKYCAQICNGSEYADIEVEEGGYPVIGSGGEFARASKYSYNGQSVLLGRKGTIDKPLFIDGAFWCVDTMFYTRPQKNQVSKFLYYCTLCFRFDYYVTSTALPSMTQKDLGSEYIAVPSMSEQQSIADFLDKQCGKIDGIISDLEKQIETLQKYKKSLILETVTKGLNKNVPMKSSGIDWIGDIPAHWDIKRIKDVSKMQTGTTPPNNEGVNIDGDGVNWFTPGDFIDGSIELSNSEKFVNDETIQRESIKVYPKHSILFVGIASIGKLGYFEKACYSNQQITAIKSNNIESSKYIAYSLLASMDYTKSNALYTTVPIINNAYLGVIKIPFPEVKEQKEIVGFLDKKCSQIDVIVQDKQEQLEKIKQHKKSLIYEYVTGKKRVKEASNGN